MHMPNAKAPTGEPLLRNLPPTDELLRSPEIDRLNALLGERAVLRIVRSAVDSIRSEILSRAGQGGPFASADRSSLTAEAIRRINDLAEKKFRMRLQAVINATGVVIHTNLGRAPLSIAAKNAVAETGAGYSTVEFDLDTGERGLRGRGAETMIEEITGAEAALVVNNCAAAAMLVLAVFSAGKEVIVSRGELVEIGGDFRVPDVLALSGATLREVGTTNRTKLADYERAIVENTAMILRVHPSNYRIIGFTSAPTNAELSELASSRGILFCEDAGSGALLDLSHFGLADEPVIGTSIRDGADLVTFSGDKLLGGPQAGIIAGRRELIEQMRSHPFYRALRAGKLIYSTLEAILSAFLRDNQLEEIPVLRMLSVKKEEIRRRSEKLINELIASVDTDGELGLEIIDGFSATGGGAAPGTRLETCLIAVSVGDLSPNEIAARLRHAPKPVVARIDDDKLLIDLRTVDASEEGELIDAIRFVMQNPS